jgi:hypothetical protein
VTLHRVQVDRAVSGPGESQALDSYETVLNYARSARTSTGLRVDACPVETDYPTDVKTSDEAMRQLQLRPHENQPTRN